MLGIRSRCVRRLIALVVCLVAGAQLVWFLSHNDEQQSRMFDSLVNRTFPGNRGHPKSRSQQKGPAILLWWDSVYTRVDEERRCGDIVCRVSNNRSLQYHPDTKAFIFYGSHFKPYNLPLPRSRDHVWALFHEESPRNAYLLNFPDAITSFNTTATFSRHAHYPLTTQWLQCPDWLLDKKYMLPLVDKNRLRQAGLAPILYVHSDCGVPSDRDNYVKLLQKYIPVDSYGTCVKNKNMPEKLRFHGNMAALEDEQFYKFAARYKFTLAMENYRCDDYVTEKLWRPLRLGSVPIVFGAPNVREYLPSNKSAIIIDEFQDVQDVAEYIRLLDTNDKLYRQYLEYKDGTIKNRNLLNVLDHRDWYPEMCHNKDNLEPQIDKYESIFVGYECFLCKLVSDIEVNEGVTKEGHKTHHVPTRTHVTDPSQYGCPSPRKFDSNGKYSVHNVQWAAEWNYGKYEAMAMDMLIKESKNVLQKDFYKLIKKLINEDNSKH